TVVVVVATVVVVLATVVVVVATVVVVLATVVVVVATVVVVVVGGLVAVVVAVVGAAGRASPVGRGPPYRAVRSGSGFPPLTFATTRSGWRPGFPPLLAVRAAAPGWASTWMVPSSPHTSWLNLLPFKPLARDRNLGGMTWMLFSPEVGGVHPETSCWLMQRWILNVHTPSHLWSWSQGSPSLHTTFGMPLELTASMPSNSE